MYQALYRKERPEVFSEILGQEHIVKILKHQIETDTVNHAYLFCGTRGTGKTTTARILAKAVNCQSEEDRPCGACDSCRAIRDGNYMDVIEIDAASNNGVENIRELRESVKYPPVLGKKKIYIIDEVHMLSTGAFNALLKTLEEPPESVIFILATTEPQKLPQTILSRCMRLDFKRVPLNTLVDGFRRICVDRGVEISDSALKIIANAADGSVRDGLSVLDQVLASGDKKIDRDEVLEHLGAVGDDFFIRLTEMVSLKKVSDALVLLDEALSDGKDVKQMMKDWTAHYRNLLVTKFVKNPEDMLNMSTENVEKIREQSMRTTIEEINDAIIRLSKAINDARTSTQPRILMELAIVSLATGLSDSDETLQRPRQPKRQTQDVISADEKTETRTSNTASAKNENKEVTAFDEKTAMKSDNQGFKSDSNIKTDTESDVSDSELDMIWHEIIEIGEDSAGSFGLIRSGTRLAGISSNEFKVICMSRFAVRFAEEKRKTLEGLMERKMGKHLDMRLLVNSEDRKETVDSPDMNQVAKDISETLGIDVELE